MTESAASLVERSVEKRGKHYWFCGFYYRLTLPDLPYLPIFPAQAGLATEKVGK
jgi:hypothetical protein